MRSFPGKAECLLLDFSGNIIRFAKDFGELYFNGLAELDSGERLDREVRKDDEKPPKTCSSCGFTPCGVKCIRCGFEAKRASLIEHEDGRAVEVDIFGTGKTAYARNKPQLYAALATYEKGRRARRVAEGRPPGKAKEAAAAKFKELAGHWPPRSWDFEAAPYEVPTRALQGKLRSLEIAFAKSRGRK